MAKKIGTLAASITLNNTQFVRGMKTATRLPAA